MLFQDAATHQGTEHEGNGRNKFKWLKVRNVAMDLDVWLKAGQ